MPMVDDDVFQGIAEAAHDQVLADSKHERKKAVDHPTTVTVGTLDADKGDEEFVYPTDEEREHLPREPGTLNLLTFSVAVLEFAERFGYYGCQVVLTNFIQFPLPPGSRTGAGGPDGQSGAQGMGQQASTGITTFLSFWVYITPILGAYIADQYWGRFKTISVAVAVAIVGHIFLILSAVPGIINNSAASLALLIIAIIVFGLGTGAFKSNISPLIAEQYASERLTIKTKKNGSRVIIDPALTAARVYNYFYMLINVGALVGQIGMAYSERYVGFWLSFTLPTIVFLICPIILWWGRNRYHKVPPGGSVLSTSLRIFREAGRGAWGWNLFKTAKKFDWTRAYPSKQTPETAPKWMEKIPADYWVDEVKRGFAACKVFLWFPLYWLTYNQINNNLVSQAATLTYGAVPNDVISNLDPFALLILIPICDIFIYPALRRANIHFTPIKRIAAGFFVGSAAMISAAVTQYYIYQTSSAGYHAADAVQGSPITVWVQTVSYVLIALSEIFASITSLEYAFTKAPKNMRSLVTSIALFQSALGNALVEAFLPLSHDPNLIWNYTVAAVLAFIGGIGFWFSFRNLDKQERYLNEIEDRAYAHGDNQRIEMDGQEKRAPGI